MIFYLGISIVALSNSFSSFCLSSIRSVNDLLIILLGLGDRVVATLDRKVDF